MDKKLVIAVFVALIVLSLVILLPKGALTGNPIFNNPVSKITGKQVAGEYCAVVTPASCADVFAYGGAAACKTTPGCTYSPASCTGSVHSCSSINSYGPETAVYMCMMHQQWGLGCYWEAIYYPFYWMYYFWGECKGSHISCQQMFANNGMCEGGAGCTYQQESCTGTPPQNYVLECCSGSQPTAYPVYPYYTMPVGYTSCTSKPKTCPSGYSYSKDIDSSAIACCPTGTCWFKNGNTCLYNGYKTNTPRNGVYYTCVNGVWTDNTKTCPEGYRYAEGFEISAYCDCFCTAGATCTTKSPAHTILATDVSVIPRGSRVIIPSLGITGVSEDTGGYIQGKRIDVYIPSYSRALAFGRKYNVGVCISNAQQSLGSPQCQAIQNPRCEEKNPVTGIIDCVRTGDSGAKYGLRGLCYP